MTAKRMFRAANQKNTSQGIALPDWYAQADYLLFLRLLDSVDPAIVLASVLDFLLFSTSDAVEATSLLVLTEFFLGVEFCLVGILSPLSLR